MRVAVEGHGYRGVPEKMLYEFRVDAAPQKEGSARVPQVVPPNRGEIRTVEERLEAAVDYVLSVYRRALACSENEVRVLVRACS